MGTIIKEIRLILVEFAESNSNKQWRGVLEDNGDVVTYWSRVGLAEQSKRFPHAGESFLLKKEKEKLKKGYTALRTVQANQTQIITPQKSDLHAIALQQIKTSSPELTKLIKRLVEANIHTITKNTQVQFNSSTGLFTTPLGVVTLDGIVDARQILSDCVTPVQKKDWNAMTSLVNQYLRIVPQNLGMRRLEISSFLPDLAAIQKQNDILDSLEASYQAMQTPQAAAAAPKTPTEKVFDVRLDVLRDDKERARIIKKYQDTRKDQHVCSHLKVKEIYLVEVASTRASFSKGSTVGGVQELWHGTKQANLLSILKSGLRVSPPSTARIAGKMFGNGIYFAIDSTKSLNYSAGYWDGKREDNCFMFICSVALGKYYVPKGSYENLPKPGFDSTWAKSGISGVRNDEIIVYNNDRFDLKYLVEFGP